MTDSKQQQLEREWSLLEADARTGRSSLNWSTSLAGVKVNGEEVLQACDPEGKRHLLVPTTESYPGEDKKSRGVQIIYTQLEAIPGRRQRFVDIACLDILHNDLFSVLVEDILEKLDTEESTPSRKCASLLNEWRQLFSHEVGDKMGLETLTGLFGELQFLDQIVQTNPAALDNWTGPQKDRHDFTCSGGAVEVKTSRIRSGRFVTIHGVDQLVPPQDSRLDLCFVKVEIVRKGGQSIPDLVETIARRGIDRAAFDRALRDCKYFTADADLYSGFHFIPIETRFYRVDDAFPALVPSALATGQLDQRIQKVSYTLDLSGEAPASLPDNEVDELINRMAVYP